MIDRSRRKTYRPGTMVRIEQCSGVDSNKTGVIVPWSEVRYNGRGVPSNIPGAYSPPDRKAEAPVRLDNGNLITMFKERVLIEW